MHITHAHTYIYIYILINIKQKENEVTQSCLFLCKPMDYTLQAPLSMGFSRQKYWNVLLFPYPGDLPDPVINPGSPALQADSLLSKEPGKPKIYTIDTSYNNHNKYRGFFVAYISILEQCMMESCRIEK